MTNPTARVPGLSYFLTMLRMIFSPSKENDGAENQKLTPSIRMPEGRGLVLFDGVCLLCNGFVHFVIDHEKQSGEHDFRFSFATLQSEEGMSYLTAAGLPLDVSTVVVIDEAGVHTRSTAALRVLKHCGMPYALLFYLFIPLPAPVRDLGYKAVAAVRYRLFGKDDGEATCRMMSKAIRPRFQVAKWPSEAADVSELKAQRAFDLESRETETLL